MGRSGGHNTGKAAQPTRVIRGPGERDLTIHFSDKTVTAHGRLETPKDATEPHVSEEGELYASAPIVLAWLEDGTVVDENGAAPLEPGVYLIHGDRFEKGEPAAAPEPQPEAAVVCPEITFDEWEDEVFLEAARIIYRGAGDGFGPSQIVRPGEIAYRMQADRFYDRGDRYGDEIWNDEFRLELEQQITLTLSKLSAAGCFYEYEDQYGNKDFVFSDAGWLLSDKLHGR